MQGAASERGQEVFDGVGEGRRGDDMGDLAEVVRTGAIGVVGSCAWRHREKSGLGGMCGLYSLIGIVQRLE